MNTTVRIILAVAAGGAVLLLLCCGGGFFFLLWQRAELRDQEVADEMATEIAAREAVPAVVQAPEQANDRLAEVDGFHGHKASVRRFALSPDGQTVASIGDFTYLVRLWDVKSGRELFDLEAPPGIPGGPEAVGFSSDGKTIVSGHINGMVNWDLDTRKPTVLRGKPVDHVCVSPDGARAYCVDRNAAARVVDLKANREMKALGLLVGRPAFSANRKFLFANGDVVWDLEKEQAVRRFPAEPDEVTATALNASGSRAVTAGAGVVRLWDATNGQKLREVRNPDWTKITALAFSAKADRILMGNEDGEVRLLHGNDLRQLGAVRQKFRITCLAFTLDDQYVISSSYEPVVHVWKLQR
jgi:WD40 repeat protein